MSYNNGSSKLVKKNQTIVDDSDLNSDSDYSYKNSDKKRSKRKKSKKKATKNTKSKKKPKDKKIPKIKLTMIKKSIEGSEQTSMPDKSVTEIIDEEDKSRIDKTLTLSTKDTKILDSLNEKHTEAFEEKSFDRYAGSVSSVTNNSVNNDYVLLQKNNNSVCNSANSNLLKPLSFRLATACKSSASSITHQCNTKKQDYQVLLSPAVQLIPLLNYEPGKKYMRIEKPTLEPLKIKHDDGIKEGKPQ